MKSQPWACPECRQKLVEKSTSRLHCERCGEDYLKKEGIWRFLPEKRRAHYQSFLQNYLAIRKAEGRCVGEPEFYRSLPERDRSQRFSNQWELRAKSYHTLLKKIITPCRAAIPPGQRLQCIDLGAGNCWLSNRLSEQGCDCAAVDIQSDQGDGLGCHRYYDQEFTPVEADFEHLPFLKDSFHIAIFNASLHYSEDLRETLTETLRVLRPQGTLVVLETPIYRKRESGRQMVREREADFRRRFGTPSNDLKSEHFLTRDRIESLARELHLEWTFHRPHYGFRWRLQPWKARLLGRREPASFGLLVGRLGRGRF